METTISEWTHEEGRLYVTTRTIIGSLGKLRAGKCEKLSKLIE